MWWRSGVRRVHSRPGCARSPRLTGVRDERVDYFVSVAVGFDVVAFAG